MFIETIVVVVVLLCCCCGYLLLSSIFVWFNLQDVLENLEHLEGQHSWFACTHSRPTYCNVCRDTLHGVAWNGLSCEVCKIKSHRRCVSRITDICKWTTRNSLQEAGVQLGPDVSYVCMYGPGLSEFIISTSSGFISNSWLT